MKKWYMYVIECSDGSLYCGITTDVKRRISEHGTQTGAKYTYGRGPFNLLYQQEFRNRSEASKAEYSFKQLNRKQKLRYINEK